MHTWTIKYKQKKQRCMALKSAHLHKVFDGSGTQNRPKCFYCGSVHKISGTGVALVQNSFYSMYLAVGHHYE